MNLSLLKKPLLPDDLDAAFWVAVAEVDEQTEPKSVLAKAQSLAGRLNIPCHFDSVGQIEAAVEKLPPNSRSILKIALGMGGEITWITGFESWNNKEQMKRRLKQALLSIPADVDSYHSTTVSARQFTKNITLDWLDYEIGELTNKLPDLACPLVLHVSIKGITFRDERSIQEMRDLLLQQLTQAMPLIQGVTAPFEVELIKDRDLNFSVPIRDYPQLETDRTGVDDEEDEADHYLSGIVAFLESRAKGGKGSQRCTTVAHLTAPQSDVFDRRAESALLYRHRCNLFTRQDPPGIKEIADFFEITSDQVTNVVRDFLTLASSPFNR